MGIFYNFQFSRSCSLLGYVVDFLYPGFPLTVTVRLRNESGSLFLNSLTCNTRRMILAIQTQTTHSVRVLKNGQKKTTPPAQWHLLCRIGDLSRYWDEFVAAGTCCCPLQFSSGSPENEIISSHTSLGCFKVSILRAVGVDL